MTTETKTNHVTGINLYILNEIVLAIQPAPDLGKCRFGHGIHGMTPITTGGPFPHNITSKIVERLFVKSMGISTHQPRSTTISRLSLSDILALKFH